MHLDISCKTGKLQITDEGILRNQSLFGNKTAWQVPCQSVTGFTTQPGSMMSVDITIHTTQGTYRVEMVTKQNFEKLQGQFPHLRTTVAGKEWYHNPTALTHIATYTKEKDMQREAEAAAQHGWTLQGTNTIGSHINVGRTVTAAALTGGVSLLFGASRSKKEVTITYVRTPGWQAQNN